MSSQTSVGERGGRNRTPQPDPHKPDARLCVLAANRPINDKPVRQLLNLTSRGNPCQEKKSAGMEFRLPPARSSTAPRVRRAGSLKADLQTRLEQASSSLRQSFFFVFPRSMVLFRCGSQKLLAGMQDRSTYPCTAR